jgi:hypothetical protein
MNALEDNSRYDPFAKLTTHPIADVEFEIAESDDALRVFETDLLTDKQQRVLLEAITQSRGQGSEVVFVVVILDIALPNAREFFGRCLTLFGVETGSTKVHVKRRGQCQVVDLIP